MPDPIIVLFQPPMLPTLPGEEVAIPSLTSTGGWVRVYGIAIHEPGGNVGLQGYVAISPVLSTGKISDATRLYLPHEAALALAVKLLDQAGISVGDLLVSSFEYWDDKLEYIEEKCKADVRQKAIDCATKANRLAAALGDPPIFQPLPTYDNEFEEEDEEDSGARFNEDGEELGDDLCDHCGRSGLAIYEVDDDGDTMCSKCSETYHAEHGDDEEDEDDEDANN